MPEEDHVTTTCDCGMRSVGGPCRPYCSTAKAVGLPMSAVTDNEHLADPESVEFLRSIDRIGVTPTGDLWWVFYRDGSHAKFDSLPEPRRTIIAQWMAAAERVRVDPPDPLPCGWFGAAKPLPRPAPGSCSTARR